MGGGVSRDVFHVGKEKFEELKKEGKSEEEIYTELVAFLESKGVKLQDGVPVAGESHAHTEAPAHSPEAPAAEAAHQEAHHEAPAEHHHAETHAAEPAPHAAEASNEQHTEAQNDAAAHPPAAEKTAEHHEAPAVEHSAAEVVSPAQ